jgi:protein gp37
VTGIEWTDTTWNPVTGCTRVSPGCDHCYIERTPPFRMAGRRFDHAGTGATTGVQLHPERLDQPFRWRKPRRVFVNSLSDLFHTDVDDEYLARVFAVMAATPQHTYQVLTKRPARMRALLADPQLLLEATTEDEWTAQTLYDAAWPLPNLWLGVSVEDQHWADIRIPYLLDTPAAVRFLSCEPLLGPIRLTRLLVSPDLCPAGCGCSFAQDPDRRDCACDGPCRMDEDWPRPAAAIDWVIAGGESGPGARPLDLDWIRDLDAQCVNAGDVALFVKQLGAHWAREHGADPKGGNPDHWPPDLRVRDYPKQA